MGSNRTSHIRKSSWCLVACISVAPIDVDACACMSLYAYLLVHGRLHERPGLAHRLYDAKKACISRQQCIDRGLHPPPSFAPDHCAPFLSPSLCRCRSPSFLSTNPLDPRARFLFSSNRLVKVITLIIYRPDTPSHLFQWAGRERIPVSFSSAARFLLHPTRYSLMPYLFYRAFCSFFFVGSG